MESLKAFFKIYVSPAAAMSDIIDTGNWVFGAAAVLIVAAGFYASVNVHIQPAYSPRSFSEYYTPTKGASDDVDDKKLHAAESTFRRDDAARQRVPIIGDTFFSLFSVEPAKFYQPLLLLSIFYAPAVVSLISLFSNAGSFGLVLRRDLGTLSVCTLYAWAAANLPIAILGFVIGAVGAPAVAFLGLWALGGLLFGVLMVFALRTVFGSNYGVAIIVVSIAWLSMSLGLLVFRHVSPLLFSPFLIFYAVMYFGGSIGGEVRGFGNAMRQRQNFKRFLHNATVNPRDADAHVQLGLIYSQRRQDEKALEHFEKALAIDKGEIDANYEMGKFARRRGELQKALDHFAVVLEQDDKYSLNEIWREVGATYLDAGVYDQAQLALEKYTDRRSGDPEGLYYLGKTLKAKGRSAEARTAFEECRDYARASPDFRRNTVKHWIKLAEKELG
jgi:hypothetical protein